MKFNPLDSRAKDTAQEDLQLQRGALENHATHVISTERPRREWTRDERILRPNLICRYSDIRWGSVDSIDGNNYLDTRWARVWT